MIKINVNSTEDEAGIGVDIEAKGSVFDIVRDILLAVADLYHSIRESGAPDAETQSETYQMFMRRFVMDDEFWRLAGSDHSEKTTVVTVLPK